jgi:PBSX family phage terminase large subunit
MTAPFKSKYEHLLPYPRNSAEWEKMKVKPFTPNQMRALALSNAPFNLWDGSIRSGKTFLSIAWLIAKNKALPDGDAMILGQTGETIERNFLGSLKETLGDGNYHQSKSHLDIFYWSEEDGEYVKKTRRFWIVGAKDKGALRRIRGSTLMLAYVDEATLMPKIVFEELVGRLSSKYATMLATTNPDSPNHWLIKDFVEHEEAGKDWRRFRFLLDDNLALDPEYIERIKRQYIGLPARYARMILGKWVLAEGIIYQAFSNSKHVIPRKDLPDISDARRVYVSSDYGVENPTTFLLIGEHVDRNRNRYWVIHREYYYSGRETGKQKTTKQFVNDFADWFNASGAKSLKSIIIDPSAAALITEFKQAIGVKRKIGQFYSVDKAKNEVLKGIQNVANMLQERKILVDESCSHLIEEFGLYSWDEKAQERGEDVPVKDHDHTMDALRYFVSTILGDKWQSHAERAG